MSTLLEDLALERVALAELELEADELWANRQYKAALRARREIVRAQERILELEARSCP